MKLKLSLQRILIMFFGFVIVVYTLFPIVYMIMTSVKPDVLLLASPPRFFFQPTLDNYRQLIGGDKYYQYFENSLISATASTIIAVLVGSLAAFGFHHYKFRGKELVFYFILIARAFPPATILIPVYLMIKSLGLVDTVAALVIVYSAWQIPLTIWVMRSFFADIPREIEESALLDGCSNLRAFFKIMIPLASQGLLACGILTFSFSWNEFLFGLVLTSFSARTAPVAITSYMEVEGMLQWGRVAGAGFLTTLPVLVFVLLMNRYLVKGLTFGAVKG